MSELAHFKDNRDDVSELARAALDRYLTDSFALRGHRANRHRTDGWWCRLRTLGDHQCTTESASSGLREQGRFRLSVVERGFQALIAAAGWIRYFEVEPRCLVDPRVERDLQQAAGYGDVFLRDDDRIGCLVSDDARRLSLF